MLKLLKLAFYSEDSAKRYLIILLLLEVISVLLLFKLNSVYGELYQGIQVYNKATIWHSIAKFSGLAGILVGIGAYAGVYANLLAFSIREGLTKYVLGFDLRIPEPKGQRIQEDLKKFGELITELGLALLRAGLKLPIFLAVVVSLTHWYTGAILLIATIGGTYLTKLVGNKLVRLQAIQETNEADFRSKPTITMFLPVKLKFMQINKKLKLLLLTQSGLDQVFVLLPFMLLMPLYIAKTITMGAFFQSVNALGKVIESLLVLIDNRQVLVNIQSVLLRLEFLQKEIK